MAETSAQSPGKGKPILASAAYRIGLDTPIPQPFSVDRNRHLLEKEVLIDRLHTSVPEILSITNLPLNYESDLNKAIAILRN